MPQKAIIIKGRRSGQTADILATYYEGPPGYGWCYENEPRPQPERWKKHYLVVPCFDHCGRPEPELVPEGEVKILEPKE